ncbi:MAG: hypothetical protein SCH66_13245 [Methanolobus sp.]|nr:hypothetical protein [Methanolobus sp.]
MLKRYHKALLLVIFVLCIAFSGCLKDSVESDVVTGSFNASSGTVVHISNVKGPINVYSWDGNTVEMTAQRTAYFGGKEELEKVNIVVTENEKELVIEADYPLYGTASVTVGMELKVPKDVTVKILETPDTDI